MRYGAYIHIPLCRKKCHYCGFYSVPLENEEDPSGLVGSYVRRVVREIDERLGRGFDGTFDTVYFGGGTPSLLGPGHVSEIIAALGDHVPVGQGAEITLEMNPGDLSPVALEGYRESGINRVVLGVQTLDKDLHRFLGRAQEPCTEEILEKFFSVGDIDHCVDIIIGIPTQTVAGLRDELGRIALLRPGHISAYSLTLDHGTPLSMRLVYDNELDRLQRRLLEETIGVLTGFGYIHYEISNYALEGHESRHNMKYWNFEPYIGFGPGSHSFIHDERLCNAMDLQEYLSSEETRISKDQRSGSSAAVEYILTGMRLLKGISLRTMEMRTGFRLPDSAMKKLHDLSHAGQIEMQRTGGDILVSLTSRGLYYADRVIYEMAEGLLDD